MQQGIRIAIVCAAFPPETIVAGRMAFDLAAHLSEHGHDVRAVCPYPSRPLGTRFTEFEDEKGIVKKVVRGVTIIRVPSYTSPESQLWRRMRESWSFGHWVARVLADSAWRPAVVYEDSWPMLAQGLIAARCRKFGIPRVTHIMDTYPESAFAKVPGWCALAVGKPLFCLDRANARQALKVVTVSESMRRTYESSRGVPANRLEVIHTWQDEGPFAHRFDRVQVASRYNVDPRRFTFAYLGNIGAVAGVEHLICSFQEANLTDAQMLIIGQGSRKDTCVQLAARMRARVQFISDPEVAHVPMLQSLADVCLLPLKRGAAYSSVPSKLSAYMLSGKPVLAAVDADSDSARLIRAAECGCVVEPEDVETLAQKMHELHSWAPGALAAAGARGRTFALAHLSKAQGVRKLAGIVLEAAGLASHESERALGSLFSEKTMNCYEY